jgi:hypothetical protein
MSDAAGGIIILSGRGFNVARSAYGQKKLVNVSKSTKRYFYILASLNSARATQS